MAAIEAHGRRLVPAFSKASQCPAGPSPSISPNGRRHEIWVFEPTLAIEQTSLPSTQPSRQISVPTATIYTPLPTGTTVSGYQRASSSGFSAGSKAGIGVGITIGILTTIALAVWLVKRKRRSLSDEATETESGTAELHNKDVKIYETEVETYSKHELAAGSRPELGGNPRSELDGGATREIPGIHALHEVDGQAMDGPGGRFKPSE